MIIRDVMTKSPVTVTEDSTVTEAKALMTKNNFSKLPVLDKSKRLVGLITKNDIQKASPSDATTLDMFELGYLLSKLTVGKYMTKKVITVQETEVVEEAARIMVDNNIGCVPVMKDDVLVGIVTENDLFRLFTEIFGARHSGVRAVISQPDKPGQLANITNQIAELKGNLISVVTREMKGKDVRRSTLKVTGITAAQMETILKNAEAEIVDLRVI
ncbi:MAG: CBS and ACT domain-containing protein [Treponema sp.]|nr:CBS and ACT domain-containing protein [Treponema sp.]